MLILLFLERLLGITLPLWLSIFLNADNKQRNAGTRTTDSHAIKAWRMEGKT